MRKPTPQKNPMQPVIIDKHGVARFKENKIIRFVIDWAAGHNGHVGCSKLPTPGDHAPDLNTLASMDIFDKDDWTQLAQLIGYSVSAAGDLSYFDDKILAAADSEVERITKPTEAK